jgi:hypothetical protein
VWELSWTRVAHDIARHDLYFLIANVHHPYSSQLTGTTCKLPVRGPCITLLLARVVTKL